MASSKHAGHGPNDHDADEPVDTLGLGEKLVKEAAALYQKFASGDRAFIATLDVRDPLSIHLAQSNVRKLWAPMLHPPLSYRGEEYQYRTADGSNNLGKAGLPYAKSVPGKGGMQGARPDPGDLFDLLMARKDDRQSGSGISSMLLYHASIIIHDIFRTNSVDKNISDTSSYLDLSPLYGYDKASQETVRSKDPKCPGFLKPDTFADRRLLLQPPGVCIYLIMYNRFHNYVAEQLLSINENGKFSLPSNWKDIQQKNPELFSRMLKKQDEDLFQTARLITCGLYINISLHDYLRVLMGFHAFDTPFVLDPRDSLPKTKTEPETPRATGNMVSVEFNLLYRFHSAISIRDKKWSEAFFKLFLSKYMATVTDDDILDGEIDVSKFKDLIDAGNASKLSPEEKKADFETRNEAPFFPEGMETIDMRFDGMQGPYPKYTHVYKFKRDPITQKFDDQQLVAEMVSVLEDPICQFGAQNVPRIFKAIEILGILQARKWEVATLNEFREFFGLPKHQHFEDINSDPEIAGNLRSLYGDPDMVELYPGFLCEGDKRNLDPGAVGPDGLTPALWTAVFSDAITLVRSDRFYTIDWNVASLTTWGMREVSPDPKIMKGSVFCRLFQRAFPGYFKYNSLHLWQPFITPAMNLVLASKQNVLQYLSLSGLEFDSSLSAKLGGVLDPESDKFNWGLVPKLAYAELEGRDGKQSNIRRKFNRTYAIAKVDKPEALIRIGNYDDIANIILGSQKAEFQNPGLRDIQMIPAGPLQDVMTGTPKGVASIDKLLTVLKAEFAKNQGEAHRDFFQYFVEMAKEITTSKRKTLQKTKLNAKFFQAEELKLKNMHEAKRDGELGLSDEDFKELSVKLARVKFLWQKAAKDLTPKEKAELEAAQAAEQVFQIDLVKEFTIPIITRFFADYLGFWDRVKTKAQPARDFSEVQIHDHIRNCQDYLSYCADETTQWKRRLAFRDSLKFLKELAEHGVHQNSSGWTHWNRTLETTGDSASVVKMRKLGLNVSRELAKVLKGSDAEVAATMLKVALDVAHTSVLTFTQVVAHFIDPKVDPDNFDWCAIQEEAFNFNGLQSLDVLQRYILEAQRLSLDHPWIRRYSPSKDSTVELRLTNDVDSKLVTLKAGDKILLDMKAAQLSSLKFPSPSELSLDPAKRPIKNYLGYATTERGTPSLESKQLMLLGLAGMLKYLATLKDLRVAHDRLGRLKMAKTPRGVESYMTVTWDELVPFPTTWSLRFTGEGRGVSMGGDNADQGHGMDQVYQKPVYEATSFKIERLDERISTLEKQIKECAEQKALLVAAGTAATTPSQSAP